MLVLIGVDVVLLVVFTYLVLRVGHVTTHGKTHLAEALLVAEVTVETFRRDRTDVSLRVVPDFIDSPVLQTDGGRQEATLLVDAGTLLVEVVEGEREPVIEKYQVDTEVILACHLPRDALRGHLTIAYTAVRVGVVLAPCVAITAAALVTL